MEVSNIGDLTSLAKDIDSVFKRHFDEKVYFTIAFTFNDNTCHWVTNVDRDTGISIMIETATKMKAQIN